MLTLLIATLGIMPLFSAPRVAAQETVTLKIDGIGGVELQWLQEFVKPKFQEAAAKDGVKAEVEVIEFTGKAEDLKQRYTLDLGAGGGADILAFDGFWTSEFVKAKLLKPLNEVVGKEVDDWDGWKAIPEGLQMLLGYEGKVYGLARGTDARVVWYRKDIFKQAGLPDNFQPKSWQEWLDAAKKIKAAVPTVTAPIQLNAGKAMGEASTLQGYMMALLGAGHHMYDFEKAKWIVRSKGILDTLNLYDTIYNAEKLGNTRFQLAANGRDQSFEAFAKGEVAMLVEGDFLWRGPLAVGSKHPAEMANRNEVVGFFKMPAMTPGSGYNGQDFVTISGGTGFVLNPNTKNAKLAWKLLAYMNSKEALEALQKLQPRIRARQDVPVVGDEVMSAIAKDVLPLTTVRPPLPEYSKVSEQVQLMTERVITGEMKPDQAMEEYAKAVTEIVGKDNVVDLPLK
jgi:multiple sugar transport system substrate-binding protein